MIRQPLVHFHDIADVQMRDVGWVDGVPVEGRQGLPHVHLGLTRPEHVKKNIENTLLSSQPSPERGVCVHIALFWNQLLMINGAVSLRWFLLNLFYIEHVELT